MSLKSTPRTQQFTNMRSIRLVLGLCWLAVLFDGIDTFMYGATIPSMTADTALQMTAAHAGNIGSYATFGMLIGALSAGTLTDIIGRRWGIIVCTAIFSVASAVCALAPTAAAFGVARTIAGVGLGGLLPTAIAMVSEFASPTRRNLTIGMLMTAHQAGGIVAALLGLWLLPGLGWRSIYWVGVIPLIVLVPLVLAFLPESVTFLVAKGRIEKARAVAERLGMVLRLDSETTPEKPSSFSENIAKLFRGRNALITPLFWCASFGGLLLVYGVSTWLPSLMRSEGYNLGSSLGFLVVINLGGILGMLIAGRTSDTWGPVKVSLAWFLITAAAIFLLGFKTSLLLTYVLVFVAGVFLFSAQTMVYAAVAHVYPTETRATAIGWTTGMGRFGAVFGPWMGGQLFATHHESWGFAAFALAALFSVVMLALVQAALKATGGKTARLQA